jgi:hypothetical protein
MLNGQACCNGIATSRVFLHLQEPDNSERLTPLVNRRLVSPTGCRDLLGKHLRVSILLSSVSYVDQTHAQ